MKTLNSILGCIIAAVLVQTSTAGFNCIHDEHLQDIPAGKTNIAGEQIYQNGGRR